MAHRAGMITKREIRLLSLCYLELHPGEVFWDVGAGSGSVAVEAARLSSSLRVFAIEKSKDAMAHIVHNVQTFALANVQPIWGKRPRPLPAYLTPMRSLLVAVADDWQTSFRRWCHGYYPVDGWCMNCITLENFALGWELLRGQQLHVDATSVQLAHTRPLGTLHRFEADSPLFIVQARKI